MTSLTAYRYRVVFILRLTIDPPFNRYLQISSDNVLILHDRWTPDIPNQVSPSTAQGVPEQFRAYNRIRCDIL